MPGCWEAWCEKPRWWLRLIFSYANGCRGLAHRGGHQLFVDRTEGLSDIQQQLISVTVSSWLVHRWPRGTRCAESGPCGQGQLVPRSLEETPRANPTTRTSQCTSSMTLSLGGLCGSLSPLPSFQRATPGTGLPMTVHSPPTVLSAPGPAWSLPPLPASGGKAASVWSPKERRGRRGRPAPHYCLKTITSPLRKCHLASPSLPLLCPHLWQCGYTPNPRPLRTSVLGSHSFSWPVFGTIPRAFKTHSQPCAHLASQVLARPVLSSPFLATGAPGASLSNTDQHYHHFLASIPNPPRYHQQNLQPRWVLSAAYAMSALSVPEGRRTGQTRFSLNTRRPTHGLPVRHHLPEHSCTAPAPLSHLLASPLPWKKRSLNLQPPSLQISLLAPLLLSPPATEEGSFLVPEPVPLPQDKWQSQKCTNKDF